MEEKEKEENIRRRGREEDNDDGQMDKQTEFPFVFSTLFVEGVVEKLQSFDAS